MFGVPANLPLQRFVGDAITSIGIGQYDVHFTFGRAGTISVEGGWELHDRDGCLVDGIRDHAERDAYRLHVILNDDVAKYDIEPPHSFSLTFASGHRLTIYDDMPQYESFAIHPDGIVV